MADDSGLCVDALGGAPGVFSARFAGEDGDDAANNRLLIEKMSGKTDRRAHYTCVLAAVRSAEFTQNGDELVCEGECPGTIAFAPMGEGGFGYDPYFYLPQEKRTAAELSQEEKNAQSHRGEALRRMAKLLEERWGWKPQKA